MASEVGQIKKIIVGVVVVVVFVVGGGAGYYFYNQYQKTQNLLRDPAAAAAQELETLMTKVSKHILLPGGEVPKVATVADKSKLANIPFFTQATTGDKVLIYTKGAKAILYRPSIDKIIEVSATSPEPEVAGSNTVTQLSSVKLAIYNSTNTAGLASVAEKRITSELSGYETVAKKNSMNNYKKTMVIVLKPEAQNMGTKLGDSFKAEVTTILPTDEAKPEGDLMLILGEDFKP